MKFEVVDYINYKHPEVFDVFIHHLEALSEFIPDVKEIRVLEKEDKGDTAVRVNHWIASAKVPGFAKKFLDVEEVGWIDRAKWNVKKHYVDYALEISGFEKYVKFVGHNEIVPEGDRTKIVISADMDIDLKKHPAIPRLLANSIKPKVEKFIIELIKPNLVNSNRALEKYLAKKAKKK